MDGKDANSGKDNGKDNGRDSGRDADDAQAVLAALRLGWSVAEMRGRNRPGGPPGEVIGMPDHADHPLPLRIERGPSELRIEIQSVVAELATDLGVDGPGFGAALGDKAKLLAHVRAAKAADALRQALDLLAGPAAAPHEALPVLEKGLAVQRAVIARRRQAVAAAQAQEQAQGQGQEQGQGQGHGHGHGHGHVPGAAPAAAPVGLELAGCAGEEAGAAALEQVIAVLRQAAEASPEENPGANREIAAHAVAEAIRQRQQELAAAAQGPWSELAELIWQFDAHVQDRLAAVSESQAIGYQLGRGLADTYWALDPGQPSGSTSWGFLLGERRCDELSRLTGRLAGYMGEYTAPAIAGSLEIWKDVARMPRWLGDPQHAEQALYSQIRRWFELVILGQDPTTLIRPAAGLKNFKTLQRAFRLFGPELVATVVGLGFLVALLFLINVGSAAAWLKTLSGILAVVGLSLAGLAATIKNSAQALLKRLRQDTYTDLVAIAVQTAPPPPGKSDIENAIARRRLTPATPN
jgi:hypothetical protein